MEMAAVRAPPEARRRWRPRLRRSCCRARRVEGAVTPPHPRITQTFTFKPRSLLDPPPRHAPGGWITDAASSGKGHGLPTSWSLCGFLSWRSASPDRCVGPRRTNSLQVRVPTPPPPPSCAELGIELGQTGAPVEQESLACFRSSTHSARDVKSPRELTKPE